MKSKFPVFFFSLIKTRPLFPFYIYVWHFAVVVLWVFGHINILPLTISPLPTLSECLIDTFSSSSAIFARAVGALPIDGSSPPDHSHSAAITPSKHVNTLVRTLPLVYVRNDVCLGPVNPSTNTDARSRERGTVVRV